MFASVPGPIGLFDSGYGGLTIFDKIHKLLPTYDYVYLGDNARAPYGPRSFEVVYQFTRQAVAYLFEAGCQLVILACNTASAKALRTIQQKDLPRWDATRRVLGVIRPTVECVDRLSCSKHVGVLGTSGTISSRSYEIEIFGEAQDLKRKYFGPEGELYKKRASLMKPIQDEIYNAVKEISEDKGYQIVWDRASAMSIIFASPKIDISNEVLIKLGYSK